LTGKTGEWLSKLQVTFQQTGQF